MFNSYSKAYNLRYAHSGTLFEGRFRAKPIQSTRHLLHLCRYIHGNPVKDGLAADPADWPWSNYREFIGEQTGSFVDIEFVKTQFGDGRAYKQFLFQYLKSRQLPEDVQSLISEVEK
jgi:putative transposase